MRHEPFGSAWEYIVGALMVVVAVLLIAFAVVSLAFATLTVWGTW